MRHVESGWIVWPRRLQAIAQGASVILRLATATVDHLTGDERGIVRGQERNRRRLLFRPAGTFDSLLGPDVLTHFFAVSPELFRVRRRGHHYRSDGEPRCNSIGYLCAAWRYRIDPDAIAAVFHGQHLGEGEDAALAYGIRQTVETARGLGAEVHDGPGA